MQLMTVFSNIRSNSQSMNGLPEKKKKNRVEGKGEVVKKRKGSTDSRQSERLQKLQCSLCFYIIDLHITSVYLALVKLCFETVHVEKSLINITISKPLLKQNGATRLTYMSIKTSDSNSHFYQEGELIMESRISLVQSTENCMLKPNFLEHNRNQAAGDSLLAPSFLPLFSKCFR